MDTNDILSQVRLVKRELDLLERQLAGEKSTDWLSSTEFMRENGMGRTRFDTLRRNGKLDERHPRPNHFEYRWKESEIK